MAMGGGWHDEGDEGRRWSGPDERRQAAYGGWSREDGGHRGRGPRSYRRSDARILEDVSDRLTEDRHVDASDIEVRVEGGEVTFTGMVDNRGMRRLVEDLALGVPGVVHVQNNLRLRQQGTTATLGGYGTPVAAAYGLDATPSADAPRHGSTDGPAVIGTADTGRDGSTGAAKPEALAVQPAASRAGPATMRTIMALFDGEAEAERAARRLADIGVARDAVSILRDEGAVRQEVPAAPQEERGILASLASLFLPAEDRHSYEEGIRRGGVLLAARVSETQVEETIAALESAGAVDLDERIGQWQAAGWKRWEPMPGTEEAPASAGRRVRSYAAEGSPPP
jgi:hypothetical protein